VSPKFLDASNIFDIINGSSIYALLAVGMAFVLFTREIDVSVGATMGLAAAVAGTLNNNGVATPVIFLMLLVVGAVVGMVNAAGVVLFGIPSIVMTLGTMGIIRGIIYVYTDGHWLQNFTPGFLNLSRMTLFGKLGVTFLAVLVITALLYLLTKTTQTGRSFKPVGDNLDGARLIGIPVGRIKLLAFAISGVLSAIAGLAYATRVAMVTPADGTGYEMTAIAACVIGGISLVGGEGTPFGAVIGAILMNSISSILVFLGAPSTLNNTITGTILIAIVVVGAVTSRRTLERLRRARLLVRVEAIGEG